jgi:hypothetical protein
MGSIRSHRRDQSAHRSDPSISVQLFAKLSALKFQLMPTPRFWSDPHGSLLWIAADRIADRDPIADFT